MRVSRRPPALVQVRRAPHVVVYWDDEGLVLENYRTGDRVRAAPVMLAILAFFDGFRDRAGLRGHLPEYSAPALDGAVADLLKHSMLERPGRVQVETDRAFASWKAWHPAAGLLHFSSKGQPYEDGERARRALRARATRRPRPPAVKRYRGATQIALPKPQTTGDFPRVLLERRTWRRFSPRPVPLGALSTLLGLSSRVQYWADVPGVGRLPLKTYPSGGAQHPLEVYVLARRVDGLAPGLYHYASDVHRLERLKKGATGRQIVRYLPTQDWYRSASALILITAAFPRTQWKYEFSRAYRAVLTEAGHLCQNMCLTATWLGLAPFCSLALADSAIEHDLGIDGVSESVLYAAGVGMRPPGTDWAPWPTRRRRIRRTPNARR
jgi:SagB-type dehydrogenase family enzyme